jgi:hypothetical protein
LLVFPDSFDKPAPVILEGRDLLCRCESAAVQCVCHYVIVDLAMEVAEQVQISRKRQPLLSTKWIYPARMLSLGSSLTLFFHQADLLAQPTGESLFQFRLCPATVEVINILAVRP